MASDQTPRPDTTVDWSDVSSVVGGFLAAGVARTVAERDGLAKLLTEKIRDNADAAQIEALRDLLKIKTDEITQLQITSERFTEHMRRKASKWPWPLNYFL